MLRKIVRHSVENFSNNFQCLWVCTGVKYDGAWHCDVFVRRNIARGAHATISWLFRTIRTNIRTNIWGWGIKSQLKNLGWLPLHYHWSLYHQGQCCKGWRCLPTHKWWATHPFGEFVRNSNSYEFRTNVNKSRKTKLMMRTPLGVLEWCLTHMLWGAMLGLLWGGVWIAQWRSTSYEFANSSFLFLKSWLNWD